MRNPLAIFGALEIKDEIGVENACHFVNEGAERIKKILDELSEWEKKFRRISKTIL